MVCQRCVTAIEHILEKLQIPYKKVELGIIELHSDLSTIKYQHLQDEIEKVGFELIEDNKKSIVNKVKTLLISTLNNSDAIPNRLSDYISNNLENNYQTISQIFSSEEGITIEKYYIKLKIEKAKELLSYQHFSLKEVAYRLNYSSVSHLSKQFKENVGIHASEYIKQNEIRRKPLDKI